MLRIGLDILLMTTYHEWFSMYMIFLSINQPSGEIRLLHVSSEIAVNMFRAICTMEKLTKIYYISRNRFYVVKTMVALLYKWLCAYLPKNGTIYLNNKCTRPRPLGT